MCSRNAFIVVKNNLSSQLQLANYSYVKSFENNRLWIHCILSTCQCSDVSRWIWFWIYAGDYREHTNKLSRVGIYNYTHTIFKYLYLLKSFIISELRFVWKVSIKFHRVCENMKFNISGCDIMCFNNVYTSVREIN